MLLKVSCSAAKGSRSFPEVWCLCEDTHFRTNRAEYRCHWLPRLWNMKYTMYSEPGQEEAEQPSSPANITNRPDRPNRNKDEATTHQVGPGHQD